jgi:hypothetical protein
VLRSNHGDLHGEASLIAVAQKAGHAGWGKGLWGMLKSTPLGAAAIVWLGNAMLTEASRSLFG